MLIAEITVQGVEATASIRSKITAGMVGATVRIRYPDPYWSGLVKNVVFRGAEEQSVLNTGETVEIPARVIAKANARLMIGIVGVSATGNTQVTPTIWAELGVVNAAPYVSQQISGGGKPPALGSPPSQNAPLWAQVEAMIGDLNALGTNDRANVVAAINELVRQTGNVEGLITDDKTSIVSAINWIVREGIGTPEIGSNGTPEIGSNGNWIIGGKDTGLPSRGPKGDQGASGVYVGSGEMPDGYNVQIDPDGEPLDLIIDPEAIKNAVDEYLEENPPAQGAPGKTPVKGEDYFTPADVQEIAEAAAGLVEIPEGGNNVIDMSFLFDSGQITIPAGTTIIDTGLCPPDLTDWQHFYVRVAIVAGPWVNIQPDLFFRTYALKMAVGCGSNAAQTWFFERLVDGNDVFRCTTIATPNGNLGGNPPSPTAGYDIPSKIAHTISVWNDHVAEGGINTMKVYIPAQTQDINVRVVVGGLVRRGE